MSPGKVGKCWEKLLGEEAKCIKDYCGKRSLYTDNCLLTILFIIKEVVFILT